MKPQWGLGISTVRTSALDGVSVQRHDPAALSP